MAFASEIKLFNKWYVMQRRARVGVRTEWRSALQSELEMERHLMMIIIIIMRRMRMIVEVLGDAVWPRGVSRRRRALCAVGQCGVVCRGCAKAVVWSAAEMSR